MKNINEVYVDVITGHLHVMLNELFNAKANLVVLDNDLQLAMKTLEILKSKEKEYITTITEQIERIRELEDSNIVDTNKYKTEFDSLKSKYDKLLSENDSVSKKASHIDTFTNQINRMKSEMTAKDDIISIQAKNIDSLKQEIEVLKTTNNKSKKLKS